MYHCCKIKPDDIYYLKDTDFCSNRIFSIGFCPICGKPVAELSEYTFTGGLNKTKAAGIHAQQLMLNLKDDILYSMREVNYRKTKSKPFGWRYGKNRAGKSRGKSEKIYQYACDFYGNKELIKTI